MDWQAFYLSLKLASLSVLFLLPVATLIGRYLAYSQSMFSSLLEALVASPLIFPPSVMGFYLLSFWGKGSWIYEHLNTDLVFEFEGLLVASIIINLPFAVFPIKASFVSIPEALKETIEISDSNWFFKIFYLEAPMIWPSLVSAFILSFAHTMGEFGVALMIGGNIPEKTRTISISIYDKVQAFDLDAAANMSLILLSFSLTTLVVAQYLRKKS